jgi:hypothetical protein
MSEPSPGTAAVNPSRSSSPYFADVIATRLSRRAALLGMAARP